MAPQEEDDEVKYFYIYIYVKCQETGLCFMTAAPPLKYYDPVAPPLCFSPIMTNCLMLIKSHTHKNTQHTHSLSLSCTHKDECKERKGKLGGKKKKNFTTQS